MSPEPYDVAIVGGSFAGLAAALMLARGRRRVAVFDDGLTRNRFAASGHGFLGMDGMAPEAMRLTARAEVLAYPTVTLFETRVTAASGRADAFRLQTAEGEVTARRLILAYGMRDILTDLPGLAACWGKSAIQCPYCHGYEVADRPTGFLVTDPAMAGHAVLFIEWTSDLTVFANGHILAPADAEALAARGVAVEPARVASVEAEAGMIRALVLEDGRRVPRSVL
jgi:thioredoxin reductase